MKKNIDKSLSPGEIQNKFEHGYINETQAIYWLKILNSPNLGRYFTRK